MCVHLSFAPAGSTDMQASEKQKIQNTLEQLHTCTRIWQEAPSSPSHNVDCDR